MISKKLFLLSKFSVFYVLFVFFSNKKNFILVLLVLHVLENKKQFSNTCHKYLILLSFINNKNYIQD